ncbi:MAG: ABC transporter ATP-binding protein [Helicobacteraceae bacterium]|jgi:ABC-2 type transport system ATP-binding protein|nr:ABC transporter ATP-binding protein [Helicobacteraceae bacterium]
MIKITNLLKRYDEKVALDHLTLEIKAGTIFGLLGPNGAGKTTLISILNGLTKYNEGEVTVFGLPLDENLEAIRKRCALIPQTLAFYENLTVIENLNFFGGIQNIEKGLLKKNIEYAVETNRLGSMLHQRASTLSGGQKRRLNIAIGLLNDPDILFFDEPTVGIDPESRNEILETILSFKEANKTVIYTSHYMPEIEKICDEVAIINAGKIIKQGSIESMLTNESANQLIIEIYETPLATLESFCSKMNALTVVDESSLMLEGKESETVARALALLEAENVAVKNIRYGTTTLESLFINLTSKGRTDV